MNIAVFRLTETEICVDGIIFIKSPFGVYRAEREEYQDLNIFRNYIESFLQAEANEKEQIDEDIFNDYLSMTLLESNIRPSDMPF